MTARLVRDYLHPAHLVSGAMGGLDVLPGGNVLIGWGLNPGFTEHTADGKCVLDVQYNIWDPTGEGRGHYRVYKSRWVGRPAWPPSVAWEKDDAGGGGASRLFLSWNGATEVVSWQIVRLSLDSASLRVLSPSLAFQTCAVPHPYLYLPVHLLYATLANMIVP